MARKKAHLPRFLGIGAARCGTTWLGESLSRSPDVWIPRIKEIHYFTRSSRYLGPSQLEEGTAAQRLFSPQLPYKRYRRKLLRAIASNIARPSLSKLHWDANFLLRKPGDDWYASLFSQGYGKVTGEITPRYCVLGLDDAKRLRSLIPDLKLLFLMREPVDRTWSILKYHEKRQGVPLTSLPLDELRQRAFHKAVLEQSDYASILQRWRAVFPAEQMLVACFDEIVADPKALLARICRFLGIGDIPGPPDAADTATKVNASFVKPMPAVLQSMLIAHYAPMISRLAETEGGYVRRWLSSYEPMRDPVPVPYSDPLQLGNRISESLGGASPYGAGQ